MYERWHDGSEHEWGQVILWEPPERFAITWELLPAQTEVEVRFRVLGPALTRVEVEHRGWERLSQEELAACAAAGGYDEGWEIILARFASAVAAEPTG